MTETSTKASRPVFKTGLPHVAYVLLWYPLFTQPFIFREVEGLKGLLPLSVYSLYGPNLRHCSNEMRAVAGETRTYGMRALGRVLGECFRQIALHPLRSGRLFRKAIFRRWRSWETLGENLWAFCAGMYLGRLFSEAGIDMIYAPWPRGTATAAWVASQIAGLPFATAARGDNLEPADPDLGDKLTAAFFVRANNEADKTRIEVFAKGQAKGKVELIYNSLTLPPLPETDIPASVAAPKAQENAQTQQPMERPVRLLALGRFDVTKGFDVLICATGAWISGLPLQAAAARLWVLDVWKPRYCACARSYGLKTGCCCRALFRTTNCRTSWPSTTFLQRPAWCTNLAAATAFPTRLLKPWPTACPW